MSREIKLTNSSYFCIVDDEDFDYLNKYRWSLMTTCGYVIRYENNRIKFIHRLILKAEENQYIDHINTNKLDNQKKNLRFCSYAENSRNRPKYKTKCSSRFKGVHWHKRDKRWSSTIMLKGKYYYLGYFEDEISAAKAYNEKAIELHGEFASINLLVK
jgi:hypothetical protein